MGRLLVRFTLSVLLIWLFGFAWFALWLPQPAPLSRTEAVIVLTGGKGRLERGIQVLEQGHAARMFVSGVDPSVRPRELAAALHKPRKLFACCIDIGKRATNTRTNAEESADWIAVNKVRSIRLVTTDWHMRRALLEFTEDVPAEVNVLPDSIASSPTLATLFLEYNKYLARRFALWGGV
jgi:uncharacterized SAM-binding protein YcdF (DUF218 family)